MSEFDLQPLTPCPPDLLPQRGEGTCGWGCDLVWRHPGNCAEVSLSGMVIDVLPVAKWDDNPPQDWDDTTAVIRA
ncbi:hypothetical protein [Nocardia niwae]|uniref:hypothetical protein n=1 Tax=Nocardia niwae TaxID=626084 RepID=UPI0007A4C700|nr:hypothetical protein [Nocardia niwae]